MKRNEMIASLTGYLMDYKKDTDAQFNSRDLAEFVLDCVERQNMKPPHHPERRGSVWCSRGGNWDDEVYEWENEE